MASEKQIAANRANAKRSTGPKTAIGKSRSRWNAFRHGLSLGMARDEISSRKIDALARALVHDENDDQQLFLATLMADAQISLLDIEKIRTDMMAAMEGRDCDSGNLRRLAALDRYERYAQTKRRRALEQLEACSVTGSPHRTTQCDQMH